MRYLLLILSALALSAQTPKAKIVINVTDDSGQQVSAKITGTPASAGLDTLKQWLATQTVCDNATPAVCTPKYADAADFTKLLLIGTLEQLAPKYPSAQTLADVAEIDSKIAALAAKRKALFDAARGEK